MTHLGVLAITRKFTGIHCIVHVVSLFAGQIGLIEWNHKLELKKVKLKLNVLNTTSA